jgi:hypothetical protein
MQASDAEKALIPERKSRIYSGADTARVTDFPAKEIRNSTKHIYLTVPLSAQTKRWISHRPVLPAYCGIRFS